MICEICNITETKGNNKLCDSCRLKKWRKDNPKKIKAYNKMRQVRDSVKIKARQKIASNNYYFGGNRTKVLERDNYTCQSCGLKTEDGKTIVVHHKDRTGFGKKNKNNNMDNLITLCVQCHLKTHNPHTYVGKNKKKDSAFVQNTSRGGKDGSK
jgi:hypothetical protein